MCFSDSRRPVRVLLLLLSVQFMSVAAAGCPPKCKCLETEIHCDNNAQKNFPRNLPFQARYLDISRNRIKLLPPTELSYLPDLTFLNCSYNFLTTVSRLVFLNVVKLVSLDLSHNHLRAITRTTLQPLRSLSELWLNNNEIVTIEEFAFSETEGLHELDISHNDIMFLNITSLKKLEGLKTVRLANNPWTCQCSITALGDWINEQNETFPDSQFAVCSLPEQYAGTLVLQVLKLISNICNNPLDSEDYMYFVLLSSCILISSIILVGVIGISRIYFKRWKVSAQSMYDIEEHHKVYASKSVGTITNESL